MRKLIALLFSVCASVVFAADSYQVYDFAMSVKTTKGKGAISTSCGGDYLWRDQATLKIQGIIAGCGCGAINADGVCVNALVLLWDATSKTQITNAELTTWIVQRIGKKGEKVEHIAQITTDDFSVTLAGLGSYAVSKIDAELDHVSSISGNFAGTANAPYFTLKGSCSACYAIPDSTEQTTAVAVCEDGTCTAATQGDITPFFGSYTLKYNKTKSTAASKKGLSRSTLKTPEYVDIDEGFFD